MAQAPDRIRKDIESTRADLSQDVERLAERTVPKRIARRRWAKVKQKVGGFNEKVMGTPKRASRNVASTARSTADDARSLAGQAGDRAGQAASQVKDAVREAPARLEEGTRGNPIAAGMIAFGAGLLTASLIPESKVEERAGRRIAEQTGEVRESLAESAREVKDRAAEVAREAGEEIAGAARDAARTTAEQARTTAAQAKEDTTR